LIESAPRFGEFGAGERRGRWNLELELVKKHGMYHLVMTNIAMENDP
jgi:hypothetical protein